MDFICATSCVQGLRKASGCRKAVDIRREGGLHLHEPGKEVAWGTATEVLIRWLQCMTAAIPGVFPIAPI